MLKYYFAVGAMLSTISLTAQESHASTAKSAQVPCTIYVVRHGETDWNTQDKIHGHSDVPINELGERQAVQLKEILDGIDFVAVYSSDLMRAHRTAEIVMQGRPLSITKTTALRERFLGK